MTTETKPTETLPALPTPVPDKLLNPKSMPGDMFEYGRALCAAYKEGWEHGQTATLNIIDKHREMNKPDKNQTRFW